MQYAGVFLALFLSIEAISCDIVNTFPKSAVVKNISFDLNSLAATAFGSDNWATTWSADDYQYTTWGDGAGFDGGKQFGRVSFGVARIDGAPSDFVGINLWGGYQENTRQKIEGKSYGILSVDERLWLWKTGDASEDSAFFEQSLYYSDDRGRRWHKTPVIFNNRAFQYSKGFFAPTFLQFGAGYQDALDNYVYIYAPEINDYEWEVQRPGRISLFRVPINKMDQMEAYEYYSGSDINEVPIWTHDITRRTPVFFDERGVMRTSVTYNAGLDRYFLITQQLSRFKKTSGKIGIFEATKPWGPWFEVLHESPWALGIQRGTKTVFWNFANKWTSEDGTSFYLIYTGPSDDNFGLIQGTFELHDRD